jgi:polyvinyl alcohol dehydrogenase (cytochrome)
MAALRHRVRGGAAALCLIAAAQAAQADVVPADPPLTPQGSEANPCARAAEPVAVGTAQWNGWGRDLDNSRYQPEPAIRAADVAKLAVKWVYGFRGSGVFGQPSVVDGRLFVTSSSGRVYSLDARSGCTYWTYDAAAAAGTAVSVGEFAAARAVYQSKKARRRARNAHIDMTKPPSAVFFGDDAGFVYALDAQRGTLLWKSAADSQPTARIRGAPVLYRNRLYVPVSSSLEDAAPGADAASSCCTFRGGVVALDIVTGQTVWRHYTIPEAAQPVRRADGTEQWGPAGAAVGSAPTVDARRGVLYVATGRPFGGGDSSAVNAIEALDLEDGRVRWRKQPGAREPAAAAGASFDGPPILRTLPNGRQVLLAGQRSGAVYALDPDLGGEVVWQARVGDGAGGAQWGPAADHRNLYVARAGLAAIDLKSGVTRWHAQPPPAVCSWAVRDCPQGQSQALTVMPGIAFAGALDGHLRAYSTIGGDIVWDFDTARSFPTVNGVAAAGGSLNHGGPTIVGGMMFVNSGAGDGAGRPGNALLAFSVGGK